MDSNDAINSKKKEIGRWLSIGIVAVAALLGLLVSYRVTHHPRTDDATVLANYIGIAPQVEGPLTRLNVHDNQLVKPGELLFEIDERPYQYALENAISEQAALEGQIVDEKRVIAAQESAIIVAEANIRSAEADVVRWEAAIDQGRADVANGEQNVRRTEADWEYASNNLHRLEPLLLQQFVTVDEVDKARSVETAQLEVVKQAKSQLMLARAGLKSAEAQYKRSEAIVAQSHAQHQQATNAVTTLEALVNQRGAKEAAVRTARYNFTNCWVFAPFEARVTNLTISEGAYAHVGQQMFILIDTRRWWALANFREGQLNHISPGMRADVYVLSDPTRRFSGFVDSIGFGVTPDSDLIGSFGPGLPDVQRTLNWVHLASRFPVRVLVDNPAPELFRISESAVVIIRGK